MCYLPRGNRRFVLDRGLPETEETRQKTSVTVTFPRCLSVFGLTCTFGSAFRFSFGRGSARLRIRTLASGCTFAPVLRNPSSVTSSDLDLVSKNTASSVATFRLLRISRITRQHAVLPWTRKGDSIYDRKGCATSLSGEFEGCFLRL